MSPYLVLLILEFFPARLAMLESYVPKPLANLLTEPFEFYFFANCFL